MSQLKVQFKTFYGEKWKWSEQEWPKYTWSTTYKVHCTMCTNWPHGCHIFDRFLNNWHLYVIWFLCYTCDIHPYPCQLRFHIKTMTKIFCLVHTSTDFYFRLDAGLLTDNCSRSVSLSVVTTDLHNCQLDFQVQWTDWHCWHHKRFESLSFYSFYWIPIYHVINHIKKVPSFESLNY